ncbi:hypothetical protein SAMN02745687_01072 [Lachnospiraceae bacterium NK3A20]|nr:hypothetical protein SAMN02745687_01072 [Lachnospiraceae bacterium NK3A20]
MCHLRQKSAIEVAKYGRLKLSERRIPNSSETPCEMVVQAEKSAYSWML